MAKRESKSVRVNPDLWKKAKHYAIDENTTLSELVEKGLKMQMEEGEESEE